MSLPTKSIQPKQILNIYDNNKYLNIGLDRVAELMIQTDNKTKHLPRGIAFDDIDVAISDFVENGVLKLVLDGDVVPVIWMENERWGEFIKTWKIMDDDKNIPTPYITIRRVGKAKGTRLGSKTTIPQPMFFTYMDVPIMDEGQMVYLRYKMPQPTNVDLKYEITLFAKFREDVNRFDELVLKTFSSINTFTFIKGSPMPITLDDISEPRIIDNTDGDKMYVCKYPIKIQAFTIDEKDFIITKTSRKPFVGGGLY